MIQNEPFRLYENPSFLEGIARLVDFTGLLQTCYNYSETDAEADYRAFQSDWETLGNDLRRVYLRLLKDRMLD